MALENPLERSQEHPLDETAPVARTIELRGYPAPTVPDDGLDLAQLWSTLRSNRGLILKIALGVLAATMVITALSPMKFKASGRLYLGELEGSGKVHTGSSDIEISEKNQGDVGSEVEIMRSRSLVLNAVREAGLNVTVAIEGEPRLRFWRWLLSGRDRRLLDVPAQRLSASDTALLDEAEKSQSYSARFVSDDAYELWSADTRIGSGKLNERLDVPGLRITLKPGTERGPRAGERYELNVRSLEDVATQVVKTLEIAAPKALGMLSEPVKVLTLDLADSSPHFAVTLLKQLMASYLSQRQDWKTEDATAAESFVTNQLQVMRESLDGVEKKLAEYRSTTRVVVLDNEAEAMVQQVGKYEEQRVNARLQVAALSAMQRALKTPNVNLEAFLVGDGTDPVLAGLSRDLSSARQELVRLSERFSESAPDIRQQRAQVDSQVETIRNYLNNRLGRARDNLSSMNQVIGQFEEKLKSVPGAEFGLAQLQRESDVYNRMYSYLLERQHQTAIIKASTVSKNRVLDAPRTPRLEDEPMLALRLGGAGVGGLLLGVLFVLMRHMFASTLQTLNEVQRVLRGTPIYTAVPLRLGQKGRADHNKVFDVFADEPNSAYAEAFRLLRTRLRHALEDEAGKVILVTSACPGDGKTTCALSLAATLAADQRSVLIVDADLRKPTHHALLGYPSEPGLSNVLNGECDFRKAVRPITLAVGEVFSVGGGRIAQAELLSSERFRDYLLYARTRYDYVVLDCSSFPLVSDALFLADYVDAVLSVIRLQTTPRRVAIEHIRGLSQVARLHGVIVNGAGTHGSVSLYPPRPPEPRRLFGRAAKDPSLGV